MNKTLIVIQREYTTRVKKKSFILLTILTPFLLAALIVVPLWLATIKSDDQQTVMLVDQTGRYAGLFKDDASYRYVPSPADSASFYSEDSDVEAVILIRGDLTRNPRNVVICSRREVPADLLSYATNVLNEQVRRDKLAATGINGLDRIIEDVQSEFSIPTVKRTAEGESSTSSTTVAMVAGFLFTFVIYFFVMTYGAMVMQGVMEEKTNRIMELMVSSIKPFQLMMGKIVGIALVGFTQIVIWGVLLAILLSVCGGMLGLETAASPEAAMMMSGGMPPAAPPSELDEAAAAILNLPYWEMAIMFVIYFIGGYLLYASFFAAVGASVNEQEDSSQFVTPVVLIMLFGLYAAMYSIENTDGPLAFWSSLFPLTSPIVMMVRIPFGVPLWQELLSIVLLFGSALLVTWVGAKIYRVGILMYGKKPTLKEMLKWLRYK